MAMVAKPEKMECLHEKDVLTTDGRLVGTLRGARIDPATWTVTRLIVDLKDDVADELDLEKSIIRTVTVNFPVAHVKAFSDVVLLDIGLASLRSVFASTNACYIEVVGVDLFHQWFYSLGLRTQHLLLEASQAMESRKATFYKL
jgi:sporulation protein YlmC with PRC-barrel domain